MSPVPRHAVTARAGTWLAFAVALFLALARPVDAGQLAIGAVAGALLIVLGFAAAARCRVVPAHGPGQRARLAALAAASGAGLGAVLLGALALIAQREPALRARFAGRLTEPAWHPWALGFESSILEEVVFRLFAMSVVAWLVSRLRRESPSAWIVALVVSALLFGGAHLPAWLTAAPATLGLVGGVLLLNGAGGLLLGWIFWRWGLPYAIVCHFFGDLVVQSLGPRLLG